MTRFVGIDPATKTGFVALDIDGNVLMETELKGKGPKVPGEYPQKSLYPWKISFFSSFNQAMK